ncbi:MAG: hypothetical protein CMI62_08080 [Parvibaculum sp.]|jgi:hypothetical protein|uniref:hypothetical protein n=1 Tax=Parvibaculum sp. TaxID=2024848 RepID=UPI000C5F38F3|nr:hypothetical protein [Parvibaculum sp.]MAU60669.1 hypothetical protein [Parvibaculum sp.]|tara:strand:- start:241 stop:489 length:249 start_codon:yes stop_codon:yes gene_type:complete
MNLDELRHLLIQRNIKPEAVYLDMGGEIGAEKYSIERSGLVWEVYYAERGQKSGLKRFAEEDEACRHLLALLEDDTSVWKKS